jgi:hypothetical protein
VARVERVRTIVEGDETVTQTPVLYYPPTPNIVHVGVGKSPAMPTNGLGGLAMR